MQHIAEEAFQSELDKIIIITAQAKNAIADHFDNSIIDSTL